MRIEREVFDAIRAGAVTAEQIFDCIWAQVAELERAELAKAEAVFIARGIPADDVRRETERHARELDASRERRLADIRAQLEASGASWH